jgi:serine/threonine protein kinase
LSGVGTLQPGTIVAGYEIEGVLGQGGMAVVYRATQRSLKRTVALKLLATELSGDPRFRERFEREGQVQAALDHVHIVTVYEAGASDHGLFLAMRLIRGPTLKQLIASGELTPRRTVRLLAQVAQALDAAHGSGLIHRDVKPQNILIGDNDHAYLADFGLIKAPDEVGLTGTGQFMGTIDYVSPEQIRGDRAEPYSDVYALTAVLYECLTGEVPFKRPTEAATLQAQLVDPPPKCSDRRPELPVAIDDVIARGLAKDPAQRPLPVARLIRDAARALATAPSAEPQAPAQSTRATPTVPGPGQETAMRAVPGAPAEAAPPPLSAGQPTSAPAEVAPPPRSTGQPAPLSTGRPAPTLDADRSRRSSRALPVLLAVLAAAAIAAGFLLGRSGEEEPAPAGLRAASAGGIELRHPAGWRVREGAPRVGGVRFEDPLVLEGAGGRLTAGPVRGAAAPSLLPPSIAGGADRAAPRREIVRLGEVQAYRYDRLRLDGSRTPATVFAAATSAGTVLLACQPGSAAGDGFADECAAIAATLRLSRGEAYALAPDDAFAGALSSAFDRLRTDADAAAESLRSADAPVAQAAAARRLAASYAAAAGKLREARPPEVARGAHRGLVTALSKLAGGYRRAAAAAADGDDGSYTQAGIDVRVGGAALRDALGDLRRLGYRIAA